MIDTTQSHKHAKLAVSRRYISR